MSMKPIQIPSAPIKPREVLDHHQVVTWTLKWTRWIWTTEKLIITKLLQFLIQDQLRQLLILTDVFPEFRWRLLDQIMGRLDQLLSKYWPAKILQGGLPLSSFFSLISLVKAVSVPLAEGYNRNLSRGSPIELYFIYIFICWMGSGFH